MGQNSPAALQWEAKELRGALRTIDKPSGLAPVVLKWETYDLEEEVMGFCGELENEMEVDLSR